MKRLWNSPSSLAGSAGGGPYVGAGSRGDHRQDAVTLSGQERLEGNAAQPCHAEQKIGPIPLRVLVAEDHPICRELLGLVLDQLGVEATLVCDGQEAVDVWRREPFDVLLLDIHMPRLTGLEATRIIRSEEGGRPATPIVVVSSDFLPEHISAALDAGADLHIGKPITATVVAGALQSVLGGDH